MAFEPENHVFVGKLINLVGWTGNEKISHAKAVKEWVQQHMSLHRQYLNEVKDAAKQLHKAPKE
jgi:hypothetical protein